MAKRRLGPSIPESSTTTSHTQTPNDEDAASLNKPATPPQRQPAALGKIHEIDLGRDASLLNQQRTEIAIRRARGEQIPVEEPAVVKKPRLGRNGKPRRGPKRRNSEDLKRDQLVEQVLHESRRKCFAPSTHQLSASSSSSHSLNSTYRLTLSVKQSRSTTSQKQNNTNRREMTTVSTRMSVSRSSSGRISSMPCRRGSGIGRRDSRRRRLRRVGSSCRGDRSWEGVGARERR